MKTIEVIVAVILPFFAIGIGLMIAQVIVGD